MRWSGTPAPVGIGAVGTGGGGGGGGAENAGGAGTRSRPAHACCMEVNALAIISTLAPKDSSVRG
jgi:hypothetical protein